MKIAIIHYWLTGMRGGEKVLETMCEMFPDADIFTHVLDRSALSETLNRHAIRTTFIQRLPFSRKRYPYYLPLMPMALERIDLRGYDLVISSESGPAKGVIPPSDVPHICYCHTPMRYLWDMHHEYMESMNPVTRFLARPLFHYLRMWDVLSSFRVDRFVANSAFVAHRIERTYRTTANVIHPPVACDDFRLGEDREDFYLMAGQLVDYKRFDMAVDAFNRLGRKLVVIGDGPMRKELERKAGDTIRFLGHASFETLCDHYSRCRALVFPGCEDFGIVPVEAMASGAPIIAYGKGGALETVQEGTTGLFFHQQTPEALMEAIRDFESRPTDFHPTTIRTHALQFNAERFKHEFQAIVDECVGPSVA